MQSRREATDFQLAATAPAGSHEPGISDLTALGLRLDGAVLDTRELPCGTNRSACPENVVSVQADTDT